jgi:translation initiation factor IF-2
MPANIGETDVLNYLVKTGPISLADLVLRFDDPPKVLRTLDGLREREEVNIDQGDVIKRIINHIDQVPPHQMQEVSYNILRDAPEAKSIVRLTDRGYRKAIV